MNNTMSVKRHRAIQVEVNRTIGRFTPRDRADVAIADRLARRRMRKPGPAFQPGTKPESDLPLEKPGQIYFRFEVNCRRKRRIKPPGISGWGHPQRRSAGHTLASFLLTKIRPVRPCTGQSRRVRSPLRTFARRYSLPGESPASQSSASGSAPLRW